MTRPKRTPRPVGLPAFIQRGIYRAERERMARNIALPMRAAFDALAQGEIDADVATGTPVMRLPATAPGESNTDWCAIPPAIEGWIELWASAAPDINTYHLAQVARRLDQGKDVTPRLVEQAREEFEACVRRIPTLPTSTLRHAVLNCQIRWQMEAMRDNKHEERAL